MQTSSSFWTKSKKIKIEKNLEIEEIFKQEKILENEFNSNLKINLSSTPISNSFKNNLDNNNGRINYTGKLKDLYNDFCKESHDELFDSKEDAI